MTTTTTTQRIYVASLSDYNAGILHGVWIDLDGLDVDDVWEKINAMLKTSVAAKKYGDVAEEYAIHDFEGFGDYRLSEYESIETVVKLADLAQSKGMAALAWIANGSASETEDLADLESGFDEAYCGEWSSEKEYAENYVEDTGWGGLTAETLESIYSYLDWDSIARDLFMDFTSIDDGEGGIWVFRS